MIIYLFNKLNVIVVKNKLKNYCIIYNKLLYFLFKNKNSGLEFNKDLRFLKILNYTDLVTIVQNFFKWDFKEFKKIKYLGKGFKLKKNDKIITLLLNKSHNIYCYAIDSLNKKVSKNKIILIFQKYNNDLHNLILCKPLSIYTKRGLRLARQKILKKKGKSLSK